MNFPEYLKYFDYHISHKVIDFHVSSNQNAEELKSLKANKLFATLLFQEQETFLATNKLAGFDIGKINEKKSEVEKREVELKGNIGDFLHLAESCRSMNDYDTSTSYRKKIVSDP
jgi:hypothetical protein